MDFALLMAQLSDSDIKINAPGKAWSCWGDTPARNLWNRRIRKFCKQVACKQLSGGVQAQRCAGEAGIPDKAVGPASREHAGRTSPLFQ